MAAVQCAMVSVPLSCDLCNETDRGCESASCAAAGAMAMNKLVLLAIVASRLGIARLPTG
jgi:hypothetical protein